MLEMRSVYKAFHIPGLRQQRLHRAIIVADGG
jgi:hypothetical protein